MCFSNNNHTAATAYVNCYYKLQHVIMLKHYIANCFKLQLMKHDIFNHKQSVQAKMFDSTTKLKTFMLVS